MYLESQDSIGAFLKNLVVEPGSSIKGNELYENYTQFCDKNGLKPLTQKDFGQILPARGINKQRKAGGIVYENIAIRGCEDENGSNLEKK